MRPADDGPRATSADGRAALYAGSEWRYRTREELVASLANAGFAVEQTHGDWDRSTWTPASPDTVIVARRV